MRKLLSCIAIASFAMSAAAAPRLESIERTEWGYTDKTTFAYDAEGRLASVVDGTSTYTFDYSALAQNKLKLTRVDKTEYYTETTIYDMTLNAEGYVEKAVETYNGETDEDYVSFEYTDGYLTSYKQVRPDEVEEDKITWADGNIVKIEHNDGSASESSTTEVSYNGVENAPALPLFETFFNIDLDDYEYVALAGFVGNATKSLPVTLSESDYYEPETPYLTNLTWTIGADGYPTGMTIKQEYDNSEYTFGWSETTGIAGIGAGANGIAKYYSIDGVAVSSDAKGLIIEVRPDGSTVKRINR